MVRSPNALLSSLSDRDYDLVSAFLRTVELSERDVLVQAGDALNEAYFPHSGVIALVVDFENGERVGVAIAGRTSVFGAFAGLDGNVSPSTAIVQLPGIASVIDVVHLKAAANQSPTFRILLSRHEQAMFAQAQQSAACNATHSAEARLARWLLQIEDLTGADFLSLTQEALAELIGVRRNRISLTAHEFQEEGLIRYSRGQIEIRDRPALIGASCECYQTIKLKYELLHEKH